MRKLLSLLGMLCSTALYAQEPTLTQPQNSCGDGVVQSPESCDDGNDDSYDLCRNDCTLTPIYTAPEATGLKSPKKARNLALGMTALGFVPVVGIPFLLIGPSAGHIYAKEYKKAANRSLIRIASTGAMLTGLGILAANCFFDFCDPEIAIPSAALATVGVVAWTGLTVYDLIDAPRAALRYNANLYEPSRREEVLPTKAAPWPEKMARRAREGTLSPGPRLLFGGAVALGASGLILGGSALSQTFDIRQDIERAQSDGAISLEESQSFTTFEARKARARALGIGADTLFALAIPLGAAGYFLQKKQRQIAQESDTNEVQP